MSFFSKKSFLFLIFLSLSLSAADNVWTQETKSLSPKKSDAIIKAYLDENQTTFEFDDDVEPVKVSEIEDNILVVGLSLGYGAATETVSNTRGSRDEDYSVGNFKFILGKDFTLWHAEYTQPVRFYLSYAYSILSTDVDYTTVTFGIKENMRFWPLYETDSYIIYPAFSYEIGSSSLKRGENKISGRTSELAGGLVYQRDSFEYALNLIYNQTAWEHPIEGIKDESQGLQMHVNVNYRWMYDE